MDARDLGRQLIFHVHSEFVLSYKHEVNSTNMAQPSIVYALVARQTVVLAEHNGSNGNASTVALKILDKLAAAPDGNRASYLVDNHAFHVLVSGNMTYLAMTPQARVEDVVLSSGCVDC